MRAIKALAIIAVVITALPFSPPQPERTADPETAAVMERVRQEQAEALAEDAPTSTQEPQTEDLE